MIAAIFDVAMGINITGGGLLLVVLYLRSYCKYALGLMADRADVASAQALITVAPSKTQSIRAVKCPVQAAQLW